MENPAPKDAIPEGEWQVSEVPSGSTIGRGMCAEKRRNDHPEEGGTLNSGCPGAEPLRGAIHEAATGSQHEEDGRTVDPESGTPQGGVIALPSSQLPLPWPTTPVWRQLNLGADDN